MSTTPSGTDLCLNKKLPSSHGVFGGKEVSRHYQNFIQTCLLFLKDHWVLVPWHCLQYTSSGS
jgi:hypothetical protein